MSLLHAIGRRGLRCSTSRYANTSVESRPLTGHNRVSSKEDGKPSILRHIGMGHLLTAPVAVPDAACDISVPAPPFSLASAMMPGQATNMRLNGDILQRLPPGYLASLERYLAQVGLPHANSQFIAQAFIQPNFVTDSDPNAALPIPARSLAFVGDAILSFLVSSFTIQKSGNVSQDSLHFRRLAMLNNDALSRTLTSSPLSLSRFIIVSSRTPTPRRAYFKIQSTALEAFCGAVYLDSGFSACVTLFADHILPALWKHQDQGVSLDPISSVQTTCQRYHHCLPNYRVLESIDKYDDREKPSYTVGIFIKGKCVEKAEAETIFEAKKAAALKLIGRVGLMSNSLLV